MVADYIVLFAGLIVAAIGYVMRPTGIGWFLLGFGAAHVYLGILDLVFRQPSDKIEEHQE
jgi:hypothetical protein